MSLAEAALACRGTTLGALASFSAISTDSRTIGRGELFVALAGERFDGHEYVAAARSRGAAAAMVDAARAAALSSAGLPLLAVDDTRLALGRLAASWRQRFSIPVIELTGSNGKTTTKEMLRAIFAAHFRDVGLDPAAAVLATQGNLNNDIGLPLTLLALRAGHRVAIVEAGMNRPGEIAYLTDIVQPGVGLVVNAMRAHLEGMASLPEVAREKGALFERLPQDAIAVLNVDSEFTGMWHQQIGKRRCISFSLTGQGDVNGECLLDADASRLKIGTPLGSCEVVLHTPGRHNVQNALAATAAAIAAGCPLAAVQAGLAEFRPVKGRLQRKLACNGATLYDDSYNANPDSMRAAIDVLARHAGRRVLILGDMGETGSGADEFHREVGAYARRCGIDELHALGSRAALLAAAFAAGDGRGHAHADLASLVAAVRPTLDGDTVVLVKGSRFMKMERVVAELEAAAPQEAASKENEKCC